MSARSRSEGTAGFTLVETLIAAGLLLVVLGVVLPLSDAAHATFQAQGEVADMHQRLRAAIDLLVTDLRAAKGVRPYRIGAVRDDGASGVFYRADTISVLGVPDVSDPDVEVTRTYYLKTDPSTTTFELMRYDAKSTDLPAVEHVVRLAFDYFAAPTPDSPALVRLAAGQLTDGPWLEDSSRRLYDADLLGVRQVRVHLRVEIGDASMRGGSGALFVHRGTSRTAERFVPDDEIEFDVAMRNIARHP